MALDPSEISEAFFRDSDASDDELRQVSLPGSPEIPSQSVSPGIRDQVQATPPSDNLEDFSSFSQANYPSWYFTEGLVKERSQPKPKRRRYQAQLESSEDEDSDPDPTQQKDSDLSEVKQLLIKLYKKVEENEKLLKDIQNVNDTSLESDSSGQGKAKKKRSAISLAVRQEVRKVYRALCDNDDFEGWSLSPGKSINSQENAAVLDTVIKEVKALNPRFQCTDIREAAYRYYKTKSEEESTKRRGLDDGLKKAKRRRERILRKRKERASVVHKNAKLSAESKVKWMKVMRNDMMSSEDSSDEGSNSVRPLTWRSDYVSTMFGKIDKYAETTKSAQARRQMKPRVIGEPSNRDIPQGLPNWAVTTSNPVA